MLYNQEFMPQAGNSKKGKNKKPTLERGEWVADRTYLRNAIICLLEEEKPKQSFPGVTSSSNRQF
ncbi:MAG: hypothetical protein F6J93_18330 [Oscillatoria sp. SIO1A7]|nr:hypothetical protein [Oscillatoria sp. SIO1A7]